MATQSDNTYARLRGIKPSILVQLRIQCPRIRNPIEYVSPTMTAERSVELVAER